MRIFIAIDLPEHIKSKIFHEFEILQKKNYFQGKFVDRKNLHLTLKFLGEVSEENIEEIKKQLNEIKFGKFNCKIRKTGVFDNGNSIKVIWVDLVCDGLNEFQKQISDKFPEISSDYGKFSSHITTARVKSVTNKEELLNALENIRLKNLNFEIEEFVLMKSELMKEKRTGPIYKILERFKLD